MGKTDMQLKRDVSEELGWDPAVDAARVGVEVHHGVVTLAGHVATYGEKLAVEQAALRVSGVKALVIALDVDLANKTEHSDEQIAESARTAILAHQQIPDEIQLTVEDGWISLTGCVDWDYQRRAASQVISHIAGLRGVSNWITVRAAPTPGDIRAKILSALKRQVEDHAGNIEVTVDADTVTLRGKVHSLDESRVVKSAAWSARGVSKVIDEIEVI